MATKKRLQNSPAAQLLQIAQEAATRFEYSEDLHNAVSGVGGSFSQLFSTPPARVAFSKSPEHAAIRELIQSLPGRSGRVSSAEDYSGKILLRIPRSLHAALVHEAEAEGVILHAARNDAGLKRGKLWVMSDASRLRCLVGMFSMQPSMALQNSAKVL